MKKLWNSLKENEYLYLLFAFLIPIILLYIIFACMTVYPFGRYSSMVLDLNGQYVYYFEKFRDVITSGGSLLYSWERSLGGEFLGIFTYYLASPLSLIVCLFPKALMTEAITCLLLVKMGLSGFFCGLYLHTTRPRHRLATVLFSVLYAMSAYGVLQAMNTMWIDAMYLLPLVMLGIERLIKKGRPCLFIVTFALTLACNFYIGFMVGIFCVLYFFCRYFAEYPIRRFRRFLRSAAVMLWSALVAVAMAGVFLLCAWYALGFGKTGFQSTDYSFFQRFDFLDFFVKLLPGSYDTVRPEGLPVVYCGMLTLILLPVYFVNPGVRPRRKVCAAVLLLLLLMSMNMSTVDIFWHGLSKPNWLNYRYSFAFCMIAVVMAYDTFCSLKKIRYQVIGTVSLVLIALILVVQKMEYEFLSDYTCIWFSLIVLGLYLAALYFYRNERVRRRAAVCFLCAVVLAEAGTAGYLNLDALDNDVHYGKRDTYVEFMARLRAMTDQINESDDTLFRMEKNIHRKVNDPLALDMKGLSHSTSTLNASVIKFLQDFGYSSRSHWSKYLGGTPVSDSLLGLKYIINPSDDEIETDLYDRIYDRAYETADLIGYQNPYTPGILYTVDSSMKTVKFGSYFNPFERMNRLVTEMLGSEEEIYLFRPVESDFSTSHCTNGYNSGHKKFSATGEPEDSSVTFTATAPVDGAYYAYFPSDYPREVKLKLNFGDFGTYFGNETRRILSLGSFEADQDIRLDMTLTEDCVYMRTEGYQFWYLDEAVFNNCMMELSEGTVTVTDWDDTHIAGTFRKDKDRDLLFTSIPYDEGWQIRIDGETVQPVELLDTVMGIDISGLDEGEHTVTMKYLPNCFVYGLLISALGIVLFVLTLLVPYLIRRRAAAKRAKAEEKGLMSDAAAEDEALPNGEEGGSLPDDGGTDVPSLTDKDTDQEDETPGVSMDELMADAGLDPDGDAAEEKTEKPNGDDAAGTDR